MNSIKFHYIPPVRSRDVFMGYMELLHDTLVADERAGISESSKSFVSLINNSTDSMSRSIKECLGVDSAIGAPKDLKILFGALDFDTIHNDYSVSLQKRGDGLQARHIPFILDFVAKKTKTHHIWAYEEPENSLELRKCYELSSQFKDDFSELNQILLTTHSPAFYDLSGEEVKRFCVRQEEVCLDGDYVSSVIEINSKIQADEFLGTAAFIAERMRPIIKSYKELKSSHEKLSLKYNDSTLPVVIVEGPSDRMIFDQALKVLYPKDKFCSFVSANGCDNIVSYLRASEYLTRDVQKPLIGVFDNDDAGRRSWEKFKGYKKRLDNCYTLGSTKNIFAMILPMSGDVVSQKNKISASNNGAYNCNYSIEYMFDRGVILEAVECGVLSFSNMHGTLRVKGVEVKVDITNNLAQFIDDDWKYLVQDVDDACKMAFAEWITSKNKDYFKGFERVLGDIRDLVGG